MNSLFTTVFVYICLYAGINSVNRSKNSSSNNELRGPSSKDHVPASRRTGRANTSEKAFSSLGKMRLDASTDADDMSSVSSKGTKAAAPPMPLQGPPLHLIASLSGKQQTPTKQNKSED